MRLCRPFLRARKLTRKDSDNIISDDLHLSGSSEEIADYWVICADRGLSRAEQDQFRSWFNASETHRRAYQNALDLWMLAGTAARSSSHQEEEAPQLPLTLPETGQKKRSWSGFIKAATFAICFLALPLALWQSGFLETGKKVETASSRTTSTLPDGSTVELDSGSEITIDYSDSYRTIHLEKGAVFVDVQPNKSRPFRVQLDGYVIQAVGTAYSVEETIEKQEVVVHEGRVSVLYTGAASVLPVTLSAGEKWILPKGGKARKEQNVAPSRAYWLTHQVIARNSSLSDVLGKLGRQQGEKLIWADPEISQILISGVFQLYNAKALSDILLKQYHVEKYTFFGKSVLILKKS